MAPKDPLFSFYVRGILARVDQSNFELTDFGNILGLDEHSREIAMSLYEESVYNSFTVPVQKKLLTAV